MPFRIARTVFPLPVRLIDGLAVDARAAGSSPLEMGVHIIDVHDQA